jgi:hypothetical protein
MITSRSERKIVQVPEVTTVPPPFFGYIQQAMLVVEVVA